MMAVRPPTILPLPGITQEYSTPSSTESRNALSSIWTESSASARNKSESMCSFASPPLPGAFHADVAVRIDERRCDHRELPEELALGLLADVLHQFSFEDKVDVPDYFVPGVQGLGENGFHAALSFIGNGVRPRVLHAREYSD